MKTLLKHTLFISFFFYLGTGLCFGQSKLAEADAELNAKNYGKAITIYKNILKNNRQNENIVDIYKKLGHCYNEINDFENALNIYESVLAIDEDNVEIIYSYASLLLKTGEVKTAKKYFTELLQKDTDNINYKRMVECCDFAVQELNGTTIEPIKNQEMINSAQSEFGLSFFDNKLIFASQRIVNDYSPIHERTNQGFSDLYIATFNSSTGLYENPSLLEGTINTKYNEGTFVFSTLYNRAYYTQCKKEPHICRIMQAKYIYSKWSEGKPLFTANPDENSAHPSMAKNGKVMYFASDKPGGSGGNDIWKVTVLPDGNTGTPVNLNSVSNEINTPFDEMFPLIVGDSILFFASNGLIGMGGLDIYYSKIVDGVFQKPVNLGAPINSCADDFSILFNDEYEGGLFCSNRFNSQKSDDIFSFSHNIFKKQIFGKVFCSQTQNPIKGVKSVFTNESGKQIIDITKTDGKFVFSVPENNKNSGSLYFQKKGFVPLEMKNPGNNASEIIVFLDSIIPYKHEITGFIIDKNTGKPIDHAMVAIKTNKGLIDTTYSGKSGKYSFKDIPDEDIVFLRASGDNYLVDSKTLRSPNGDKKIVMSQKEGFDTDFNLVPIKMDVEFEIENIYYEFDKANLLPESKISLNKLVNLLNENPEFSVRINSHTDERGTENYNLKLSDERSKSVVNYLVSMNIDYLRLSTAGWGESKLVIVNAKTEEEHQKNRRTTFELTGRNKTLAISKPAVHKVLSPDANVQTVFSVQIAAVDKQIDLKQTYPEIIDLIDEYGLNVIKVNNLYKYQIGAFTSKQQAELVKKLLGNRGFADCFIVNQTKR